MNLFGLTERQFGLVFSISACGVIGSSQLNRLWLRKRSSREISMIAVVAQTAVAALMVLVALAGAPPAAMYLLVFCYLAGLGSLSPNTTAIAIVPFASHAGTASALLGSVQMAAGALGSSLVSYFHNGTAVPMAGVLLVASLASLALQFGHRMRSRRPGRGDESSAYRIPQPEVRE
jgi:DHA1 family bicyclomycin/chloramphenicol resistance-like MFS transporter